MVWVRSPVYFYKRNDTFYFSRAVPSDLRNRFKKKKIEVSLRTKSEAKAAKSAAALSERSSSICRSSFLICLPTRALWRFCSNLSFVYFPWRRFASEIRARPSIVFGPVLAPPCNLQRPFLLIAGERQAVPLRVLAPQR